MKTVSLLMILALLGCKRSEDDSDNRPVNTEHFDFEALTAGNRSIDIRVTANNVGTDGLPTVAGLAFRLVFEDETLEYRSNESTVGDFFLKGQLAAGFSDDDARSLVVGAGIPPISEADDSGETLTVMNLKLSSPTSLDGRTVAFRVEDFQVFRRDPEGGYSVEIIDIYSFDREFDAVF